MEITPEIQELLDKQAETLTAKFQDETKGLKDSQQALLAEKKAAKEAADIAAAEAERIRLEKAAKDKDVDTLTASFQEKLDAMAAENESLRGGIKKGEIDRIAGQFVESNIVDDPFSRDAMKRVYSERIDVRDGKTVVLDPQGNLTALTVEDLNKEIMTSSVYANHIRSTKASGGGAVGQTRNQAGGAGEKADLSGSTKEKASALAGSIPAFANLPVN